MCLSVREDISRTTRAIFTNFFVYVACVRGSVLLWHAYDRPHRLSLGRGSPVKCYRPGKGDGSAQRGRSVLSTIALLMVYCCAAGSTAVMYTSGVVHVLDSGQSVELDCVFAMTGFTHFDNPVVWQKTQRHERTAINVLAAIESPFLDTDRFHAAFQLLEPSKFRTSLAISSQYMIYDIICARYFCCFQFFSLFFYFLSVVQCGRLSWL